MKQKPLFTFVIPAYNGEPFLETSIHSLVNDRLIESGVVFDYEIIIINDGSKDNTSTIAATLANKWNRMIHKNFIKVINKENGQYGSVINYGLKEARGIYFKVLDVDDTFHVNSLIKMIFMFKGFKKQIDLILTDHVFEKIGANERHTQSLRDNFEPYKILDPREQTFPKDLITMHSIIYRTALLREMEYEQIEGVYYSDSQYSMQPLPFINSMIYLEIPLYRYYIGRNEQSINLKVMVRNRKHQLAVLKKIFAVINQDILQSKSIKKYTILAMRRMIQWQIMLIALDKTIKHKRLFLMSLLSELREMQPIYHRQILKGALLNCIKITRGFGIGLLINVGIKLYSIFKKNIMAEWD